MVGPGVAVVVEDDKDIRSTLTEVLQLSGFAVHFEIIGLEGVEAVREYDPDIVTVGLDLHYFDGLAQSPRRYLFHGIYALAQLTLIFSTVTWLRSHHRTGRRRPLRDTP